MGPFTAPPQATPPPGIPGQGKLLSLSSLDRAPWWVLVLLIGGTFALVGILRSPVYIETYHFLAPAILVTLRPPLPYPLPRLYVEVFRGVPLLVQLIYIAFVLTPVLADLTGIRWFRNDIVRATMGLGIGYGAYLAAIYRAGLESIPRGQTEAARSLGMSPWLAMRHIILPQAVRVILPALGT